MQQEKLYWISLDYATFAIITGRYNTTVIDAAPIARWTINKEICQVLRYYRNKGADIQIIYIRKGN